MSKDVYTEKLNKLLTHYGTFTTDPKYVPLLRELKSIVTEADNQITDYKSKLGVAIVSGALGIIIMAVNYWGR